MSIKQVKGVADIPSAELEDWGPVELPLSETISQLRGRVINEHPDGSEAGIWECTPGRFVREVLQAEMVTFLSGHCIFHPENGDPIEIKGGDVLFFPENSKGTWEIIETVRKAYLIYNIKQ